MCSGRPRKLASRSTAVDSGRAAWRGGVEDGEWVEVAHEGVPAVGAALGGLRGARVQPHEPWQERLVLGVVEAVRHLGAVRRWSLAEGVGFLREADPDDRVAGLQYVRARWGDGRRGPWLHEIVDERVIGPLRDLVAQRVYVLERPGPLRVEEPWRHVGRPGEGLDRLIAVPVGRAEAVTHHLARAVEADDAAVERVVHGEQHHVVGEVQL